MRTVCCIVAAGEGIRLGSEWASTPKAMVPLLGRPMLYYSLNVFDQIKTIESIILACPPDHLEYFQSRVQLWGFSKPTSCVKGGSTRAESVRNALCSIPSQFKGRAIIHDAARPCVTPEMIQSILEVSESGQPATLARNPSDTLRMTQENYISGEIDREKVACIETPQVFPFPEILELHKATSVGSLTDDSTLFTRAGKKVLVVYHDGNNMKITFNEDVFAAEGILFSRGWQDASEGED